MIDNPLNRLSCKRGEELPWSKLTDDDVRMILDTVEQRDQLKDELSTMTNAALAKRLGVHLRTVDRITAGETWTHVV